MFSVVFMEMTNFYTAKQKRYNLMTNRILNCQVFVYQRKHIINTSFDI